MKKLNFPSRTVPSRKVDFGSLSNVLFESAELLESARDSKDPECLAESIELAIRALYAGSASIDGHFARPATTGPGSLLQGPWTAAAEAPGP